MPAVERHSATTADKQRIFPFEGGACSTRGGDACLLERHSAATADNQCTFPSEGGACSRRGGAHS